MLVNPTNPVTIDWVDFTMMFGDVRNIEIVDSQTIRVTATKFKEPLTNFLGDINLGDDVLVKVNWYTKNVDEFNALHNLQRYGNFKVYHYNNPDHLPAFTWDYIIGALKSEMLVIDRESNGIFVDGGPRGKFIMMIPPEIGYRDFAHGCIKTLEAVKELSPTLAFRVLSKALADGEYKEYEKDNLKYRDHHLKDFNITLRFRMWAIKSTDILSVDGNGVEIEHGSVENFLQYLTNEFINT